MATPAQTTYVNSLATSASPGATSPNPVTGKTNAEVLASSTSAAQTAAKSIGETFTQGVGASGTPTPDPTPSPYQDALDAYVKTLGHSTEYNDTQAKIDKLTESATAGVHATSDKVIPLEFITGQQKAIEQRKLDLEAPLDNKLKRLSSDESSAQAGAKARLEYEKGLVPSSTGFNLSAGQTHYDSKGNVVAAAPAKETTGTPRIIGSASSGYYTVGADGKLTPLLAPKPQNNDNKGPVSTSKINAIKNTLATGVAPSGEKIGNPKGSDGYVDPYVYLEAFNNWPGTSSDFLSKFPVKNVNPASYSLLPDAIRPKVKATTGRSI